VTATSNEIFVRDALRSFSDDLPEEYPLETRFEDLGVDSMSLMDLVLRVESELGITIPDEELAELRTPARLIAFVDAAGRSA
jgi:acyl carrier protein